MMKTVILLFFNAFFLFAQPLPLLLQKLEQQNPEVLAARWEKRMAEEQAGSVRGLLWPSLTFNAGYNHVSELARIDLPGLPGISPRTISLGQKDNYSLNLTAQYLLFNGFATRALVDAAQIKSDISTTQLKATQKQMALKTIALYRQIQGLRLNVKVLESDRKRRRLQLDKVKSLLANGFVRPVDTLAVRMGLLDVGQKILDVKSRLFTLRQELNDLFGETVEVGEFVEGRAPLPQLNLMQVEQIQSLGLKEQLMGFQSRQKRSGFYPRVALTASYNYGNPGVDIINSNWMDYYILGVNLSWNLWEGRRQSHDLQAMDYARRQIEVKKAAAENRWRSRYRQTAEEIKVLRDALRLAEKRVQLARRKWEILSAQLQEGNAASKEVDDASLQITQAELTVNARKIALQSKQNELEYLSGKPLSEWSVQ